MFENQDDFARLAGGLNIDTQPRPGHRQEIATVAGPFPLVLGYRVPTLIRDLSLSSRGTLWDTLPLPLPHHALVHPHPLHLPASAGVGRLRVVLHEVPEAQVLVVPGRRQVQVLA